MASTQARAMWGSGLGSLLGLVVGAVVCFAGPYMVLVLPQLLTHGQEEKPGLGSLFCRILSVVGGLVGIPVGGILGAGLATREKSPNTSASVSEDLPPGKNPAPQRVADE